jgi:acetyltransferase-like isoleucine patch superfamily enzyme
MQWFNKLREVLKSFSMVRLLYSFIYYTFDDLRSGRFRAIVWVGLADLMPDFLSFGFLRPFFWRLAGAQMSDISNSMIRKNVFIEHPKNLKVGAKLHINKDSYLDASGPLDIGDNVTISLGCKILTISHQGINHEIEIIKSTTLKSNCIVYAGATILPGSSVEKYVIVAAGSVLSGNTVAGGIYAGIPATFKKFRDDIPAEIYQGS